CNVAYGLLGHLVECLTGTRFTDYCADHFFMPLGMVEELSLFLGTYANRGGNPLLKVSTFNLMLSEVHDGRPLCWYNYILENGDVVWGQGGSDPGVRTHMSFREKDGTGAILYLNGDDVGDSRELIIESLYCNAATL
ncbi:MAG: serine hydrolase, partial [Mesorhizobium sp.]